MKKTTEKILELTRNFVQGPVQLTSIFHAFYRDKKQTAYDAPYSVIKYMHTQREAGNYKFDTFSRVSKKVSFSMYIHGNTSTRDALKSIFNRTLAMNNPRGVNYHTRGVRI